MDMFAFTKENTIHSARFRSGVLALRLETYLSFLVNPPFFRL